MQKRFTKKQGAAIFIAMLFSITAIFFQLPASTQGQTGYSAGEPLEQKAASEGNVNVIVKLLVPQIKELTAASNAFCAPDPGKGSVWGGGQADMALMDSILYAAQGVLLELRGTDYEVKHIYKSIPYMALQASVEALAVLRSLPAVLAIEEDIPQKLIEPVIDNGQPKGGNLPAGGENPDVPLLDTSATLTGASTAWSMGYTGSGRYVAVLDTGIRGTHEFFAGKAIVEACYASGSDGVGPVGDCPNGLVSQTGAGSAVHYASTYQGWDHGTHVAGIATGNHGTLFGIAKDANIIAVKVFSMFPASSCGGTNPCVMSWSSDQLAGLDYVYSIRGSYNIAAVNMSLGGGANSSACDSDSRKTAIDNLRAVGIVTAIATGNNGYCGYIGSPACISTSVSVGSTTDGDAESGFNNWHPTMQRLFAPGSTIYSSTGSSDTSYAIWGGTSMATPHVAGAWALIKQAKPSATVTEILAALQTTGVAVTSVCDGYVAPIARIQIDAAINALAAAGISVTSPNGGENWNSGSSHNITWTSTGTIANVNIDYSANNGGDWTPVVTGTANDGSFAWTVPAVISPNCLVRVRDAVDSDPSDVSNRVFSISSAATETISTPAAPSGPGTGSPAISYGYFTGGSASNSGHSVQYKFDWDDGSDSGWLAVGTTSASHAWSANGTYHVRAMACCATHTTVESLWSETHTLVISDSIGYYNSPASRQILPEVIWASATGGGTWVSDVQVVDVSGGSQVTVYYSTAAGRRGPFLLWNNSGGSAMSSVKYANLLQTIDGLDSGVFTYDGTVGAVEFATQDGSHLIHVAVRELNGNYAKTFPGLNLVDEETAGLGRNMIIPNLANNATYRTTCGFYNPTADAVTMELKLLGASGVQTGGTVTRTLAGYEFTAFNPFTEAGVPYPGSSYDNVTLKVEPTTGSGSVMCFGATANNTSNDPAAHVAVQASGYDNGPSNYKILPEVIWASATGGGTWVSDVQVVDVSGGSQVTVYYSTATGRRGPFLLWNNSGGSALSSVKYANLLQTIDGLDSGAFTYNGTVGAVEFATQDSGHLIHVAVRELNGNYAKTFPGLNLVNAETAGTGRLMIIPNLANNATYRTTCGFYNPTAVAVTMELKLLGASGVQTGGTVTRTLAGYEFTAFNPFTEAGVPYPGSSYDNVTLKVEPTTGSGSVMCFGATANNTSNDPAAHVAVQGQ